MPDLYRFHRLAILPLLSENPSAELKTVKNSIQANEERSFLEFILKNGLGPLWFKLLQKNNFRSYISAEFTRELRNITLHTRSLYLFQKTALEKIDTLFAKASIPYAVFKGAHTREHLYTDPELRYSCDIDILVAKSDKVQAIKALVGDGYTFQPIAENISHEASLTNENVAIDLHWDILRPGRTRVDMTDDFLQSREYFSWYWALNNEATLFIMLVHPVFTKYTTAPQASLLHLLDLRNWIQQQKIVWEKIYEYLDQGGVKTAAWITATYLKMITGESLLPEAFLDKIKPSLVKAGYLRFWLKKNLSTSLLNHPLFIQTGFTLPAHDTLGDAIRFLLHKSQGKKMAGQETNSLLSLINDQ